MNYSYISSGGEKKLKKKNQHHNAVLNKIRRTWDNCSCLTGGCVLWVLWLSLRRHGWVISLDWDGGRTLAWPWSGGIKAEREQRVRPLHRGKTHHHQYVRQQPFVRSWPKAVCVCVCLCRHRMCMNCVVDELCVCLSIYYCLIACDLSLCLLQISVEYQ